MIRYLLDSSFVIAYFNEMAASKVGPARRFRAAMPRDARLFVSLVTIAELLEGARDAHAAERELRALAHVLSIGEQVARRCGLIQRRAKSAGHKMGENDAWIAATAQVADLTLIGDDHGFEDRPGLRYVNFAT
ncbi:MAG: type II toxin-antitoxin system VapC family toxin [Opitutaceae bacterium]